MMTAVRNNTKPIKMPAFEMLMTNLPCRFIPSNLGSRESSNEALRALRESPSESSVIYTYYI